MVIRSIVHWEKVTWEVTILQQSIIYMNKLRPPLSLSIQIVVYSIHLVYDFPRAGKYEV